MGPSKPPGELIGRREGSPTKWTEPTNPRVQSTIPTPTNSRRTRPDMVVDHSQRKEEPESAEGCSGMDRYKNKPKRRLLRSPIGGRVRIGR